MQFFSVKSDRRTLAASHQRLVYAGSFSVQDALTFALNLTIALVAQTRIMRPRSLFRGVDKTFWVPSPHY
jgi:hypothetical protein